jgi:hypothetical protein
MKNMFLSVVLILAMASCSKKPLQEGQDDSWNGYFKYLKQGEVVHTLWAGKNINVGTVTYGINEQAQFYVTYNTSGSGWLISETHMFAGDKARMPLNRPGSPKVGRFPYSRVHCPRVNSVTYTVPLTSLPPAEEPGFVVAAHCVVKKGCGRTETAWAEGDYSFNDKGWGWYDIFYFNQEENLYTILYGTECSNDSLVLYMVDITNMSSTAVYSEYLGVGSGPIQGIAYDQEDAMLFFVDAENSGLWVNGVEDGMPSINSGTLPGVPVGSTFSDGSYYYINASLNTINKVTFNSDWTIAGVTVMSTIPGSLFVSDIAMDLSGTVLYILGNSPAGAGKLVVWHLTSNTFNSSTTDIEQGSQLVFGEDGNLYVITGTCADSIGSLIYTIDPVNYSFTPLRDTIIFLEDPFSDLSLGPVM